MAESGFVEDDGFQALNGIGTLLIHCIDAFPPTFQQYIHNKDASKVRLQTPMRDLKDRFQRKALLRAFLRKSLFNGGEVNYLTIYRNEIFHVYWNDDVVGLMAREMSVENSTARNEGQFDAQKVIFVYQGVNAGELEMRNDSEQHYGEVRFNMNIEPCFALLQSASLDHAQYCQDITVYGRAVKTFGQWDKRPKVSVKHHDYSPTKAELEEDVTVNADPDIVAKCLRGDAMEE